MKYLLLTLIVFNVACNPITGPDKTCKVLPKEELKQSTIIDGRLVLISIVAPKTTICE